MTDQHTPTPDGAGWIEWKGGECPVDRMAQVDVKFKDGDVWLNMRAGGLAWAPFPFGFRIVAYRLSDRLADERSEPADLKPSVSAIAGAIERLSRLRTVLNASAFLADAARAVYGSVAKAEAEIPADLRALIADHARLAAGIERLGSMEALVSARGIDKERDAELLARIDFARTLLGSEGRDDG
jgi:hypothetical protein